MLRRTSQRRLDNLYSSFYSGRQWYNQMYHPKSLLLRRPTLASAAVPLPSSTTSGEVTWEDAAATDVDGVVKLPQQMGNAVSQEVVPPRRPYVPLSYAAVLELKADYMCESGGNALAMKAVIYLGVVVVAYRAHYGEAHNQTVKVLIKLGRAFRLAGKLPSSRKTLEKAFSLLQDPALESPILEHALECLTELGSTAKLQGELEQAAQYWEQTLELLNQSHDIGNSERYTRQAARTCKYNHTAWAPRFIHYSPYDSDRCFAITEHALELAESVFPTGSEGLVRVLTARTELISRKDFNRKIYAGKITHTRGLPTWRKTRMSTAPTPEELLRYSPTVHQPYFQYRYLLTSPLGKEDDVWPGTNRVVESGDPMRRMQQLKGYRFPNVAKRGSSSIDAVGAMPGVQWV